MSEELYHVEGKLTQWIKYNLINEKTRLLSIASLPKSILSRSITYFGLYIESL